jgi:hypothetical protein
MIEAHALLALNVTISELSVGAVVAANRNGSAKSVFIGLMQLGIV